MKDIYSSFIIAYDENNNIDYEKINEIIDLNEKRGFDNYFIGSYLSEFWSLSKEEREDLFKKIPDLIPENAGLIIDISSANYKEYLDLISIINEYKRDLNISLSLPINSQFSFNQADHLHHLNLLLNNTDKRIYVELTTDIVEEDEHNLEVEELLNNQQLAGFICNPEFCRDEYIDEMLNHEKEIEGFNIVYNSDEFFLSALNNKQSIISKYVNVFPDVFSRIKKNYEENNIDKARIIQEKLNDTIYSLKKIGDLQVIRYIFKLNDINLGNAREPYHNLSEEEKEKIEKIDLDYKF